jgi:tRNA-splicing ligase RtcB
MRTPIEQKSAVVWELASSYRGDMHVPVRVFADEELMTAIDRDQSLEQLVNVSTLPGITRSALGMPDMHQGYGFPVGGVAATIAPDGVISPGGIGFDINCGVRLLATDLDLAAAGDMTKLVKELASCVPLGYGKAGRVSLAHRDLDRVLAEGARAAVDDGFGHADDLPFIESRGCISGADPDQVSSRAKERGSDQLGTLGGGNHFLEIQVVDEIFDAAAAKAMGIEKDRLTVLIHSGSRGLGHQVCTDHVRTMDRSLKKHGITLRDRQLACAPLSSIEGKSYFAAMCAAANFAFANRQVLTHRVRQAFKNQLGRHQGKLRVVYDVAHNIAKLETFGDRKLCVHRKGATRAFGPTQVSELPREYHGIGQPVFVPGSMGTSSLVMVGNDASHDISLASACHGAGRAMSRTAAKQKVTGGGLRKELAARGIVIHCQSNEELAEEAPLAYKDVDRVVNVVETAGIARRVARLRPVGVLKG